MIEQERRAFALTELRIEKRKADDGAELPPMITGHAAVFNSLSSDLGGFREQIMPGAFTQAIQNDDVRALFNHDPNYVLGRNKAGTLRLMEDETGLRVEIDPPDTQAARDLMVSMQRGDINQMSFGFTVQAGDDEWNTDTAGKAIRTIKRAGLFDVSPVTYPAYPQTDCAMRSMDAWKKTKDAASAGYAETLRKYKQVKLLKFGATAKE